MNIGASHFPFYFTEEKSSPPSTFQTATLSFIKFVYLRLQEVSFPSFLVHPSSLLCSLIFFPDSSLIFLCIYPKESNFLFYIVCHQISISIVLACGRLSEILVRRQYIYFSKIKVGKSLFPEF